jgi:cyclohexanone monooxygenase
LPSTELVDTDGKGVERITEKGLVVAGVEYEVDCIVYASGFEVGTAHTQRMGFDPIGRDGVRLSDYWAEGMRTKHGMFVHGFPNLFIVQVQHGANLISNVPHNLTEAGKTIGMLVKHALATRAAAVEVTKEAEDAWLELLHSGPGTFLGTTECTPGYYNQEGQPTVHGRDFLVGFPLGAMAYFEYLDGWRASGKFEGLEFCGSPRR